MSSPKNSHSPKPVAVCQRKRANRPVSLTTSIVFSPIISIKMPLLYLSINTQALNVVLNPTRTVKIYPHTFGGCLRLIMKRLLWVAVCGVYSGFCGFVIYRGFKYAKKYRSRERRVVHVCHSRDRAGGVSVQKSRFRYYLGKYRRPDPERRKGRAVDKAAFFTRSSMTRPRGHIAIRRACRRRDSIWPRKSINAAAHR